MVVRLLAETERKLQAFEAKCLRRMLCVSEKEHNSNEYIRSVIEKHVGPWELLLITIKRRKLAWFGHLTRHDSLSKTTLQGTVED